MMNKMTFSPLVRVVPPTKIYGRNPNCSPVNWMIAKKMSDNTTANGTTVIKNFFVDIGSQSVDELFLTLQTFFVVIDHQESIVTSFSLRHSESACLMIAPRSDTLSSSTKI